MTGDKITGPKKYGLAVAGITDKLRTNVTNEKMPARQYASEKVCTISVAKTVWCQQVIRKCDGHTYIHTDRQTTVF